MLLNISTYPNECAQGHGIAAPDIGHDVADTRFDSAAKGDDVTSEIDLYFCFKDCAYVAWQILEIARV